jgi:hypothetical protein
MTTAAIASVINFCSNDFRMLRACIEGVRPFSRAILIPVCDHFFDGTCENYALLEHAYRSFADCLFIEYAFDAEQSYRPFSPHFPEHPQWRHEWANTSRWIAKYFLPEEAEYVLFLDADEILDAERFSLWLKHQDITSYSALSFAAYWYFREARYQATRHDDISLMVKKSALSSEHLWSSDERAGTLIHMPGEKKYHIKGADGHPMVHHYSWVRTKQELLKKFTTWSHHWERPWAGLLETELSSPFTGTDFIRGYEYCTVSPYFDPLAEPIPLLEKVSLLQHVRHIKKLSNVIRVEKKEMQRKEILDFVKN